MNTSYDVVIAGAGYAGMMAALRLRKPKLGLRVVIISPREGFLERVRLQETIVAPVAPRIASISALFKGTGIDFIQASVASIDPGKKKIRIVTGDGEHEIAFDKLVYAVGSNIDVSRIPGASEYAYRLDPGDAPHSAAALRARLQAEAGKPLRVVTVGGAETAVEVAGEIKTAWPNIHMTMVSQARCGDFRGPRVQKAVREGLIRLGVTLIDNEGIVAVRANEIETASGKLIPHDICVWSGGLHSLSIARDAGIATDPQGRVLAGPNLRSISHPDIFAIGDTVHPIAPTGAPHRPSAYAAVVSGAYVAEMIMAERNGKKLAPFSFSTLGQGVAIGRGGVGFFTYPDDMQTLPIIRGSAARFIRNFFVWFFSYLIKFERRFPGFLSWPGRSRVSWDEANAAMKASIPPHLV